MDFPHKFIAAGKDYMSLEKPVPAPLLRKEFTVGKATEAECLITAAGFYELYCNGVKVTKGALAPYISNPEHFLYYDRYTLPLRQGKNVLGVVLGNGFQNNPGGYIWDFDKASFRGAPSVALSLTWEEEGKPFRLESDASFMVKESAIRFDDYRFGEHYDANFESAGWLLPDCELSGWNPALEIPAPGGEARLCEAEPILVTKELQPLSVTPAGEGWVYDFGENLAGVCRLSICGPKGQKVEMRHGEWLLPDGTVDVEHIWFHREEELWERDYPIIHKDIYTLKGDPAGETYTPSFTYHGFRYVYVTGITRSQATPELLTYLVMNSALEERGDFTSSDELLNLLQQATRRSDLANFYYFPTDCPHREKNGWTADAALSSRHLLLNLAGEKSYREWLRNIVAAQDERGALPGIVPTGGWGFAWGNGPAWDSVLFELPWQIYSLQGDLTPAGEAAEAMECYLRYISTRADDRGLVAVGLGDWCQIHQGPNGPTAPLQLTDTVMCMDMARKAAEMFVALGKEEAAAYAGERAEFFRNAIRANLLNRENLLLAGNCQTSQAMGLYYGVFEEEEKEAAFAKLLEKIAEKNNAMEVGVLGARVLFRVLADFGQIDLALELLRGPEYPSYGYWIASGATSLWEDYQPNKEASSRNHHFWGDISAFFIEYIGGIRPDFRKEATVDIHPVFPSLLNRAEARHITPAGEVKTDWHREGNKIRLKLRMPEGIRGEITLPDGSKLPALSGEYLFQTKK